MRPSQHFEESAKLPGYQSKAEKIGGLNKAWAESIRWP